MPVAAPRSQIAPIQMPDFSHIEKRGQIIGRAIENVAGIVAQTGTAAMQQYQKNRSLDNIHGMVRQDVIKNQDLYGFDEEQAEAFIHQLKYRPGEDVVSYEKRISPTLNNLLIYQNLKNQSPDLKVKMPDARLDTQSFIASIANSSKEEWMGEIGEALEPVLAGGVDTREDVQAGISGRMGGRAVPEGDLEQFPGYRSLPTRAGQVEAGQDAQMFEANLAHKQAQTRSANALANQRNTSSRLNALKQSTNKKSEIEGFNNLEDVTKLEISAREKLKDINREDITGGINEEWLDMKAIADMLKERRRDLVNQESGFPDDVIKKSDFEAGKIEQEVSSAFPGLGEGSETGVLELTAQRINQIALSEGVAVEYQKIKDLLEQGEKVTDILKRIYVMGQKTERPGKINVGGRVGR